MRRLLTAALALSLLGCATLFSGTRDNVTLNSQPSGAKIFIDGIEQGTTPATISIKRPGLGDTQVTLQMAGYEDRTFALQKEFNTVAVVNIFMPVGFLIDIVTGAINKYEPHSYTLDLERRRSLNMRDLPRTAEGAYEVPPTPGPVVLIDYPMGLMVVFE